MKRRSILAIGSGMGAALALAGCGIITSKTTGSTTTVTVDVTKLDAYETAIQNGADALLANPLIVQAVGLPTATAIGAALTSAGAAINALNTQANGSQTLTFAAASAPQALVSLQEDSVTVFNAFKIAMQAAGKSVPANVLSVFDALQTIVALLLALIPTAAGAQGAALPEMSMTEAQALKTLNVR